MVLQRRTKQGKPKTAGNPGLLTWVTPALKGLAAYRQRKVLRPRQKVLAPRHAIRLPSVTKRPVAATKKRPKAAA